jgi:hypothetical protein
MAEIATGLDHPLAVSATPDGEGLLIGDFGDGAGTATGQIYYLNLSSFAPAPEPTSIGLLWLASFGLLHRRRT